MYSCHLFLISSASLRSIPLLVLYCAHLCLKCSLGISNFLEEIANLSYSIISSISLQCLLKKAILSLLAILWNSAFSWVYLSLSPLPFASPLFSPICKAYSNNHFAFLHFFCLGTVLVTTSYIILWTSVHSFSGTLFTRYNPLNLFVISTVVIRDLI